MPSNKSLDSYETGYLVVKIINHLHFNAYQKSSLQIAINMLSNSLKTPNISGDQKYRMARAIVKKIPAGPLWPLVWCKQLVEFVVVLCALAE